MVHIKKILKNKKKKKAGPLALVSSGVAVAQPIFRAQPLSGRITSPVWDLEARGWAPLY